MDWFDRMEREYEARTARMLDDMSAPRDVECAMCKEYFCEEEALETKYTPKAMFCCEACLKSWEEEYGWEYEEEMEQLETQLPVFPDRWTTIHSKIQLVG
jgi:hypothetical protein